MSAAGADQSAVIVDELHDYVDACIPLLDRMHDKRRPVYASLGFEVPKRPRRRRASDSNPSGDTFEAF